MTEDKTRGVVGEQPSAPSHNYYYGTFQGVANYPPPPPPVGLPQPAPPPPPVGLPQPAPPAYYGYQTIPGYVVPELRMYREEERLPCCGVGLGWFLFIIGFLLGAVPWYIGAFLLLCVRLDHREKPGLIACTIAALLAAIAVSFSMTTDTYLW